MSCIFISYRREDGGWASHLARDLRSNFGSERVFMDLDGIEAGADFAQEITRAVTTCEVLLAIIGPHWSSVADARGRRRLEDPNDFVRLEIATALRRNTRVIPVLVGGAELPTTDQLPSEVQALAQRNAVELRDRRWAVDLQELVGALRKLIDLQRRGRAPEPGTKGSGAATQPPMSTTQTNWPAEPTAARRKPILSDVLQAEIAEEKSSLDQFAKWVGYAAMSLVIAGLLSHC
jgi:hypothetical protein